VVDSHVFHGGIDQLQIVAENEAGDCEIHLRVCQTGSALISFSYIDSKNSIGLRMFETHLIPRHCLEPFVKLTRNRVRFSV
jgi:hypothetical protein